MASQNPTPTLIYPSTADKASAQQYHCAYCESDFHATPKFIKSFLRGARDHKMGRTFQVSCQGERSSFRFHDKLRDLKDQVICLVCLEQHGKVRYATEVDAGATKKQKIKIKKSNTASRISPKSNKSAAANPRHFSGVRRIQQCYHWGNESCHFGHSHHSRDGNILNVHRHMAKQIRVCKNWLNGFCHFHGSHTSATTEWVHGCLPTEKELETSSKQNKKKTLSLAEYNQRKNKSAPTDAESKAATYAAAALSLAENNQRKNKSAPTDAESKAVTYAAAAQIRVKAPVHNAWGKSNSQAAESQSLAIAHNAWPVPAASPRNHNAWGPVDSASDTDSLTSTDSNHPAALQGLSNPWSSDGFTRLAASALSAASSSESESEETGSNPNSPSRSVWAGHLVPTLTLEAPMTGLNVLRVTRPATASSAAAPAQMEAGWEAGLETTIGTMCVIDTPNGGDMTLAEFCSLEVKHGKKHGWIRKLVDVVSFKKSQRQWKQRLASFASATGISSIDELKAVLAEFGASATDKECLIDLAGGEEHALVVDALFRGKLLW